MCLRVTDASVETHARFAEPIAEPLRAIERRSHVIAHLGVQLSAPCRLFQQIVINRTRPRSKMVIVDEPPKRK